jgi:hypothetical protein
MSSWYVTLKKTINIQQQQQQNHIKRSQHQTQIAERAKDMDESKNCARQQMNSYSG